MNTALTADQYRDIYKWLGRSTLGGFPLIHEMAQFLWSFDTDQDAAKITDQIVTTMLMGPGVPTAADVLGADFYAMPSINATPINRLRVLADEIQRVADQLFDESERELDTLIDASKEVRESIGKMIAFAALNTPIRRK